MQKVIIKYTIYLLILLTCIVLTACNEVKAYELRKFESKVTETENALQLELDYEISNYSDEDYYFTFVFPSYIQDALITKVGIGEISADSSISGGTVITVSKDGAEMTEETIEAILNGELPVVKKVLIGKTVSLN